MSALSCSEHASQDIVTRDQLVLDDREHVQRDQAGQQGATCAMDGEEFVGERALRKGRVNLDQAEERITVRDHQEAARQHRKDGYVDQIVDAVCQ